MTHVWDMDDEEYDKYVKNLPTTEEKVALILRESRYITGWFPPYSSGAGDAIEVLLADLRAEWLDDTLGGPTS